MTTYSSLCQYAKKYGINIERERGKYHVWTDGAAIAECNNLAEAGAEICSLLEDNKGHVKLEYKDVLFRTDQYNEPTETPSSTTSCWVVGCEEDDFLVLSPISVLVFDNIVNERYLKDEYISSYVRMDLVTWLNKNSFRYNGNVFVYQPTIKVEVKKIECFRFELV
jgi:hypothetical protein